MILNGLGTVKYEELFVLYRYVTDLLIAEGVEIVSLPRSAASSSRAWTWRASRPH